MTTATLTLDETSIQPEELSMEALMRELNLQKKPSWLLAKLMNALEQKRQKRGLGWSRAWNKYGLTVFRTHVHRREEDAPYFEPLVRILHDYLQSAEPLYQDFASDLMRDPARMAFTFYHNHSDRDGRQYEGLTLSFGRKVPSDRTKRDRIDIVLEDERQEGRVDGRVDRVRIYVCPWESYGQDRRFHLVDRSSLVGDELSRVQDCYQRSVAMYNQWKGDEDRQWSHWSVRYIDYFGPRDFIPQGSSFI